MASVSVFDDAANQQVAFPAARGARCTSFIGPPSIQGQGGTDCMWWPSTVPNYPEVQSTLDPPDPCFNPFLGSGEGFINNPPRTLLHSEHSPSTIPIIPAAQFLWWTFLGLQMSQPLLPTVKSHFPGSFVKRKGSGSLEPAHPSTTGTSVAVCGVVEVAIFVYRVIGDQPGVCLDSPMPS